MHILTFPSHIAILDPTTGLGVVVLPKLVARIAGWDFEDRAQPPKPILRRWFGPDACQYTSMMTQLASIGWELPNDFQGGAPAWFNAGSTACCGRPMISLTGVDVDDTDWPLQQLIDSTKRIQEAAMLSCCGSTSADARCCQANHDHVRAAGDQQ